VESRRFKEAFPLYKSLLDVAPIGWVRSTQLHHIPFMNFTSSPIFHEPPVP
jgi:hypothetical protein